MLCYAAITPLKNMSMQECVMMEDAIKAFHEMDEVSRGTGPGELWAELGSLDSYCLSCEARADQALSGSSTYFDRPR